MLLFFFPSFFFSLLCSALLVNTSMQDDSRFFMVQIQSNDSRSEFSFEGAYVFKSNKKNFFQVLDSKAPFELKTVSGAGYIIIRGKAGDGKLVMRYKTSAGEKQSFQYIGKGEVVVVNFNPLPHRGAGTFWTAGKKNPMGMFELSVFVHTNE